MDSGSIATRYARAIHRYALRQNCAKRLYKELDRLAAVFERSPALGEFLADPRFAAAVKYTRLCDSVGGGVSCEFSRVVHLVLQNRRTENLYTIARLYCDGYRREHGICRLRLTTAHVPSSTETERIRTFAGERFDAPQVELIAEVRPELLGGFRLETDEWLLDASVARRLELIGRKLESSNSKNLCRNILK